jgi:hypothetical protein
MTTQTTTQPTRDRSYYRHMTNRELVEETKYTQHNKNANWQELAIVLAERVDDLKRRLDDGHYDAIADARAWE